MKTLFTYYLLCISVNSLTAQLLSNGQNLDDLYPHARASTGGAFPGQLMVADSSSPSRFVVAPVGSCGDGIVLQSAFNNSAPQSFNAGDIFIMGVVPGTYHLTADNVVAANDLIGAPVSTPGRAASLGQTARSAVPSSTCIVGRALSSAAAGATFTAYYDGPGSLGSGPNSNNAGIGNCATGQYATGTAAGTTQPCAQVQASQVANLATDISNKTEGKVPVGGLSVSQLYRAALANIQANKAQFTDGTNYYRAAPGYVNSYISDTSLAVDGIPEAFPMSDIKNLLLKYVAGKSTSANAPLPVGSIPVTLGSNGLPATGGTNPYCAGFDGWCNYPTSEGILSLIHLEKIYYDHTGDSSQFTSDASTLTTAFATIRLDSATQIPVIPAGAESICFGFQEAIRFTGLNATCAMYTWRAVKDLAALYGAIGNTGSQSTYNALAATMASNLGTSSALWNSGAGMFNGATIQDAQIDVTASSLFCSFKIPSPNYTAQCNAISSYLVTNYSTLTYKGFVRQSNVDFATVGFLTSGGTPYGTSGGDTRLNAGSYQRGGYWSHFNQAFAETLAITSVSATANFINDFVQNADPTMEYYAPNSSGGPIVGLTNNLESPSGTIAAARLFPGLANQPSFLSISSSPSGSCTPGSMRAVSTLFYFCGEGGIWQGGFGIALAGPVQSWLLNEGTGTTFADYSGHPNTITTGGSGAVTYSAKAGFLSTPNVAHFASGAVANAANHTYTDFDGTGPFTVAFTVSFDTLGTSMPIFAPLSTTPSGYQITKEADNKINFYLINTFPGNCILVQFTTAIADTNRHYLMVSYDGSRTVAGVTGYLDGVAMSKAAIYNSLTASTISGVNAELGGNIGSTGTFAGYIEKIKIWARVANPSDY